MTVAEKNEPVPGTAALAKGISVLRAIAEEKRHQGFSELQRVTGLPKGTLHRILRALIAEGLVRYEPRDRTYHLGLQLLSLAYQVLEDLDIREISHGELVRLRDLTGEATHLAVRNGTYAVYIDVVESHHAIGPIAKIGSTSPFHCSAVGKAIAAHLPKDTWSELMANLPLPRRTPNTITSRSTLRSHLERIRKQGYALNEEEEHLGVHGVAAPVFGHLGEVIASVCITVPSYRYDPSMLEFYARSVIDAAKAISVRMGHKGH